MRFTPTCVEGAYIVDLAPYQDSRGLFARMFCQEIFKRQGLSPDIVQANCSWSKEKGTLRGLHYQLPPFAETKLVRCLSGAVYDLVLDLRPESPSFRRWHGEVLTPENRRMLYVPQGCAHGFITLEPDSELFYMVSAAYSKEYERGIRWDDPYFAIEWPIAPSVISEKDQTHPNYAEVFR